MKIYNKINYKTKKILLIKKIDIKDIKFIKKEENKVFINCKYFKQFSISNFYYNKLYFVII